MYKTFGNILFIFVILSCLIIDIPFAFAKDRTFKGKVIDFETKQPIEGAVVVAIWNEARATVAGRDTSLKEVKEILTDKNGEWSIIGEEGEPYDPLPYLSLFIPYTKRPEFIIFKPGYESFGGITCITFLAYPHVDRKMNLEGVVLELSEKEKLYFQKYLKNDHSKVYMVNGTPFIPVKDPEPKVKNLDIPFDYPDDVRRISIKGKNFFYFKNYTVVGLKKLKTREERLKAMPGHITEAIDETPILNRLLDEEDKNLGIK